MTYVELVLDRMKMFITDMTNSREEKDFSIFKEQNLHPQEFVTILNNGKYDQAVYNKLIEHPPLKYKFHTICKHEDGVDRSHLNVFYLYAIDDTFYVYNRRINEVKKLDTFESFKEYLKEIKTVIRELAEQDIFKHMNSKAVMFMEGIS